MSVIEKPDLNIFAQDAKIGEIETFPDILRGWGVALERTAGKPPLEWFNAAGKRVDEWLMYLTQRGLAEWDETLDYPKDALVQYASIYYVALKVTKGEKPTTSQTAWQPLAEFLGINQKLDKSAVVQTVGTSVTQVISQKAATESFQPKGNYQPAGNYQPVGNYALVGHSYNKRESDFLLRTIKNNVYSKTASDHLFQPKGNYADKNGESFTGAVYAAGEIGVYIGKNRAHLKPTESGCSLLTTIGSAYKEIHIPHKSGTMALTDDAYNKEMSNALFQPKGNYQPAGNYANKNGESFTGEVYASGEIGAYTGKNRVHLQAKMHGASLAISPDGVEYNIIEFRRISGTVALISDVDSASLVPHPIPWSQATPPAGYLVCNGQWFNTSTYPKLALAYPSGQLPDLRGEFIRGLDVGRGIDSGRAVLSSQSGNSLLSASILNDPDAKGFKLAIPDAGRSGTNNQGWHGLWQQVEGQNGNETRPRNIAFLYIVRAA